jgi:hypothetical protein
LRNAAPSLMSTETSTTGVGKSGRSTLIVSAIWLTISTVLLAGSWIYFILSFRSNPVESPKPPAAAPAELNPAPWGKLEIVPIIISPPLELVPANAPGKDSQVVWRFPNVTLSDLRDAIGKLELSDPLAAALIAQAKLDPDIGGYSIRPSKEAVLGLNPDDRAKLYIALGAYKENPDQFDSFRFHGKEPEDWFIHSSISEATRKLVSPLVFHHDGFMFFADLRCVESELASNDERLKLIKVLSRESTFLVKLRIQPDMDVEPLVNYWGRGGRAKDVRPLLQSLADLDQESYIDIVHLIPPFARQRLYTYPVPAAENDPAADQDCHWTALNFFSRDLPDDRFCGNPGEVVAAIKRDYYRVLGRYQLGDLVLFVDGNNNLFHSAVYIANNILFTKNGNSSSEPWIFVNLEDVKNFYPHFKQIDVRFYRHKEK